MERIGVSRPRLDVRDLELLVAVGKTGTTVKAASVLHVTQSAVSRGLLQAEEKLGARLFERTPRGLLPTGAGQRLLAGAQSVLAGLVELERHAAGAAEQPLEVKLACECYTAYRWLPSALAAIDQRTRSLEVSLHIEHTRAPVAALQAGKLDVALVTTARVHAPLRELPLFSDEVVFVLSRTHALASRPVLTRRDLTAYPLITSTHTPEPEVRWFMASVFGRQRPKLQTLRLPLTEAIVDAARAGMGIAALSEWIAGPYLALGDLVMKRLKGGPIERPWRIAFRREAREPAERLRAVLASAAPRRAAALGV